MVGRESTPAAERLSDAWRSSAQPYLPQRRRVVGLTLTAMGALGAVAAYQTGLVRHLPDPPGPWFDSDGVDASGEAYRPGLVPDAASGLASYALTLVLAGAGQPERWKHQPWLPLALAGKVLYDALGAGYLTAEQISQHGKLCAWCLLAAGAVGLTVPAVVPEARAALQALRDR